MMRKIGIILVIVSGFLLGKITTSYLYSQSQKKPTLFEEIKKKITTIKENQQLILEKIHKIIVKAR